MSTSSNDRTGLCTFTFDDGRHCNMPHINGDQRLCFFHEKREVPRRLAIDAGVKISRFLGTNLHTASDLNNTFAMLFRAAAPNNTASTSRLSLPAAQPLYGFLLNRR
jgi:hypothetical protein